MILDRTHNKWAAVTGLVAVATGFHYRHYAANAVNGPTGGSREGLFYGIAGFLIITFACSLSLRRKVPHWPLGHAQTWLKAHIWLSLLCVPFALYHAAFHMRGVIASTVLILFAIVILSGVFGLFLQQLLPRRMVHGLSRETVFDEIPSVLAQLSAEAFRRVKQACLPIGWNGTPAELAEALTAAPSKFHKDGSSGIFRPGTTPLAEFYAGVVHPYLDGESKTLSSVAARSRHFVQLKTVLPKDLHETIDDLESICRERAELDQQRTMHRWLHTWLYVHVPLSMLLFVFLCVHAIQALRFIPVWFRFPGT